MTTGNSTQSENLRSRDAKSRGTAYVVSVVSGRRGPIPGIIRAALSVLSIIYTAGLKFYLVLYRIGIRKATHLPCAVVCVGNLTAGGTGKTPTTQIVCRLLMAEGKRVAVIIRGYGGEYEHQCGLVSDGDQVLLTARQAGDEAYLLARTLPGVPVAVGRDRIRSGRLVYEACKPDVIVMDDGMQHWRLHRDLDIVLLNACEPFDNGWTFPRGMLREPKSHLRRAGVIVLTNARRAGETRIAALRREIAALAPERPVFAGDLSPIALLDPMGRETEGLDWLKGRRVASLCALGNPASFESTLMGEGAILAVKFRFPDHHVITGEEFGTVFQRSRVANAEAVITTEKDAVKMPSFQAPIPLYVCRAAMQLNDEVEFLATIVSFLKPSGTPETVSKTLTLS